MIKIVPIPAFQDNYIWAMWNTAHASKSAVVVDPGDAQPVNDFLDEHALSLAAALVTHHHSDHIGGLGALVDRWSPPIFGPKNPNIKEINRRVCEGDPVDLSAFGLPIFSVMHVPGHTLDHLAYFSNDILFCGDTLFAAGCGRLFEGTAAQMHESLSRLAALPTTTRVFCTHEYTASNLAFAGTVEPANAQVLVREEAVKQTRERGEATLPSSIGLERETNPFLRVREPAVRKFVGTGDDAGDIEVFAALRKMKDSFRLF